MSEILVIYLHTPDDTHPDWVLMDEVGHLLQVIHKGNPAELSSLAIDREIKVFIPGDDILLTSVTLPEMSATRRRDALPYALEEQLIPELETLHFVMGEPIANGDIAVAVIAHTQMQKWLALLSSWKIKPDVLLPLSLCLPLKEKQWTILVTDTRATVRIGAQLGFTCDVEHLTLFLTQALLAVMSSDISFAIYNTTAVPIANIFTDFHRPVTETMVSVDETVSLYVPYDQQASTINLLSGPYAVKKSQFLKFGKLWPVLVGLAVIWVGLLFSYPLVSYAILKVRAQELQVQIAEIYKRHFPEASSIIAPKTRLEEKLNTLSGKGSANAALILLGQLAKAMTVTPGIQLKHLDFQQKQLTVDLTASSSDQFTAFTDFLTKQGLQARQQNATLAGSTIQATVVIEN